MRRRQGGEHVVAGLVAAGVVDLLVEIEHRNAERVSMPRCTLDLGPQLFVERAVVRRAGHGSVAAWWRESLAGCAFAIAIATSSARTALPRRRPELSCLPRLRGRLIPTVRR
jgi:hypothetical protein